MIKRFLRCCQIAVNGMIDAVKLTAVLFICGVIICFAGGILLSVMFSLFLAALIAAIVMRIAK